MAARGSASPSFHRILFLLLIESSNFEKKMSFCQIRRDSLCSFARSKECQDSASPSCLAPCQQQALPGMPASLVWARPSPLPFTLVQSPETQFLACPRFSRGQTVSPPFRPTFQGQNALVESASFGWGSWGLEACLLSLCSPPDLDSRFL